MRGFNAHGRDFAASQHQTEPSWLQMSAGDSVHQGSDSEREGEKGNKLDPSDNLAI